MSRFDFEITHIEGAQNKVADCLSRYYENDGADDIYLPHEYVDADVRLDPEFEHMTRLREKELRQEDPVILARRIKHPVEDRIIEAQELHDHAEEMKYEGRDVSSVTLEEALAAKPPNEILLAGDTQFPSDLAAAYAQDPFYSKIVANPSAFPQFTKTDNLYYINNREGVSSTYTLELSSDLVKRGNHPTFHASLLRAHEPNDTTIFPSREANRFYDFGMPDDQEWYIDEIVTHEWTSNRSLRLRVKWTAGDYTWETPRQMGEAQALDDYLMVHGVKKLPGPRSTISWECANTFLFPMYSSVESWVSSVQHSLLPSGTMNSPRRWKDSKYWIESRTHLGQFFYRHPRVGYFDGSPANPTWVPQQGVPLEIPPPPFSEGEPMGPPSDGNEESPPPSIPVSSSGPSSQRPATEDTSSIPRVTNTSTNPRYNFTGSNRSSGSRSFTAGSSRNDDRSDFGDRNRFSNRTDIRSAYSQQVDRFREQRRQQSQEARDRDRRDRHEQTRSVPDLRARMYGPTPDVSGAVQFNGHPQFPRPSDGGDLPEVIPPPNPDYPQLERERRGRAIYKQTRQRNAPHPIRSTEESLVGPWHGTRIRTLSEAVNFELWLLAGCPYAREYYSWILRSYSGDPTTWRSEGESYILRHQDYILRGLRDRAEWEREEQTRLAPVPESPASNADMLVDTTIPASNTTQSGSAPTLQPRALDDLRAALDEIDQPSSALQGPNFLGTSPASPEPIERADPSDEPTVETTSIRTSTRGTLADAINFYANRPASGWPRGMRTSAGILPTSDHAIPHSGDVLAVNTIMSLAPNRREAPLQHSEFMRISAELFSIPGYYLRLAQLGGYVADNEPLGQYPFDAEHMNHAQVAVWYITHGIGIDASIELLSLGSFARAARNVAENRADLTAINFSSGFPQTTNDLARLSAENVTAWEGLNFGDLRDDYRRTNPGTEILPEAPNTDHSAHNGEEVENPADEAAGQDGTDNGEDSLMGDASSDSTLLENIRPLVLDEADRDPNDDLLDFE
ncbi:hypothetical protein C8R43DRAFT_958020 [Mycena crocata]|nr:hypothetical protein C8R43DRAFT_958020 [Mycena crocata]